MQHSEWVVDGASPKAARATKEKLPFVSPIKVTPEMDENQKKFFNAYNTMQKELIKNGLMESK